MNIGKLHWFCVASFVGAALISTTSCGHEDGAGAPELEKWHANHIRTDLLLTGPDRSKFLQQQEDAVFESLLHGENGLVAQEEYLGEHEALSQRKMVISYGSDEVNTCIVAHSTYSMASYAQISARNQREYASLHGYHFINLIGPWVEPKYMDPNANRYDKKERMDRHGLYWQKIYALDAALDVNKADGKPLCDWIMWMDADAIYTDLELKIEDVILPWSEQSSVIVPRQEAWPTHVVINAGVFTLRNDEHGKKFVKGTLDLAEYYKGRTYWGDQDGMHHYVFNTDFHEIYGKHVDMTELLRRKVPEIEVVEAEHFNLFYPHSGFARGDVGFWQPGKFVAHLSSMSAVDRYETMNTVLSELASENVDGAPEAILRKLKTGLVFHDLSTAR